MISLLKKVHINKFLVSVFLLTIIIAPALSLAATGSNPVNTGVTYDCENETGRKPGDCNFTDLINATQRFTDKAAIFTLAFSVVVIAIAGGRFMISGDNASERTKARKMLFSVVKGILFILAAWLIVTLILNGLGVGSIVKLG